MVLNATTATPNKTPTKVQLAAAAASVVSVVVAWDRVIYSTKEGIKAGPRGRLAKNETRTKKTEPSNWTGTHT